VPIVAVYEPAKTGNFRQNRQRILQFNPPAVCFGEQTRMNMEYDGIVIKPYTHQDLTALYGVSKSTLRRWLRPHHLEIGEKYGHFYTSRQVAIIFSLIGWPPGKGEA
jgi:hypothetical protein